MPVLIEIRSSKTFFTQNKAETEKFEKNLEKVSWKFWIYKIL